MEQRKAERESAKLFWETHKVECRSIRSVKEVYQKYKAYTEQHNMATLNEYIFRTYIRKHGYQ
jgi:hypothetical protein